MKIALTEEIRELDERAKNEGSMPGIVLMENAGRAVYDEAFVMLGQNVGGKKVCIFAGSGNNGGDAFIAARYLYNNGAKVRIFFIEGENGFSHDAAQALAMIKDLPIKMQSIRSEDKDKDGLLLHLVLSDLVIDGIFGTGFHGTLEGNCEWVVKTINKCKKPVLAIDIPSGVNANDGQVRTLAVIASRTVTFALPKPGTFLLPGKLYAGLLVVADIGINKNIIETAPIKQNLITADMVARNIPMRRIDAHKNTARMAVFAGSPGMTGAAALCSESALRTGAGLVKLFTGSDAYSILAAKLTEIMTEALSANKADGILSSAISELDDKLAAFGVLALGPGLGTKSGTTDAVCHILENYQGNMVIDADALNILSGRSSMIAGCKEVPVVTPHLGEMSRLTGLSPEEIQKEGLIRIARRYASQWRSVLVLKGVPTIVATPDGEIYINNSGNPALATAGSGDVLTGIIASLICQGCNQTESAVCGVYLHGMAADLLASKVATGIASGDIIAAIPEAITSLLQGVSA